MARLTFTPEDHDRVAQAIGAAEAKTSGEICAVFTHESSRYQFVAATAALAIALVAALATALLALVLGVPVPALGLVLCQLLAAGLLGAGLMAVPRWRTIFVPRAIAAARAHDFAIRQFAAHGIHRTAGRTGVLIFVSEAERHAEIVADAGIAAKVPQKAWDDIVAGLVEAARTDRLAEGYVAAIAAAGQILQAEFPGDDRTPNALPDRLVVM